MPYYINCIKTHTALSRDFKELIPNMNTRRRMSALVKMGVSTALDALLDFEALGETEAEKPSIDAIVTATWLGCIADSEKFLANLIESEESTLNPTPFIQSTSNVVGGQLALIQQLDVYNNTFVDRKGAFETALLDAILQLECQQAQNVLVGVFDELTPSAKIILERLNYPNVGQKSKGSKTLTEGAIFFVLSKQKRPSSVAEISLLQDIDEHKNTTIPLKNVAQESETLWCGSMATYIYELIEAQSPEVILKGDTAFSIQLKCL